MAFLDDHQTLDENVEAITQVDPCSIVDDWQSELALVLKTGLGQLMAEAGFVGALKQTWSQGPVHLEGAAQQSLPNLVLIHVAPPRISAVSAVILWPPARA
jgi:hypothetical protein